MKHTLTVLSIVCLRATLLLPLIPLIKLGELAETIFCALQRHLPKR